MQTFQSDFKKDRLIELSVDGITTDRKITMYGLTVNFEIKFEYRTILRMAFNNVFL
jgi:hypothetical protein